MRVNYLFDIVFINLTKGEFDPKFITANLNKIQIEFEYAKNVI